MLQRICDLRGITLTDSLMQTLTHDNNEKLNCDLAGEIRFTARVLVDAQEFSDIRQSIVRLQWLSGSSLQKLDHQVSSFQ